MSEFGLKISVIVCKKRRQAKVRMLSATAHRVTNVKGDYLAEKAIINCKKSCECRKGTRPSRE